MQITDSLNKNEINRIFDIFYENSLDSLFLLDKNGLIVSCNKIAENLLFCKKNEIIGKNCSNFLIPPTKLYFLSENNFDHFKNSFKEAQEFSFVRKDKKVIWIRSKLILANNNDKNLFLLICKDITREKRLEFKLKRNQEKYNKLNNFFNEIIEKSHPNEDEIINIDNFLNKDYILKNDVLQKFSDLKYPFNKNQEFKLIEKKINKKLKFEKLISSISTRFIGNLEFNNVINTALRDIGEFIKVSRVFIFLFDEEKKHIRNTHEWCAEGIESHVKYYEQFPINTVPWFLHHICNRKPLIINDVLNLPPEATNFKNLLTLKDIKSNLTFPLFIAGEVMGYIGFDDELKARKWLDEDFSLLQILSQIIGNAFDRKFTEDLLKKSEEKYRNITEQSLMGIIILQDDKVKYVNNKVIELGGYSIEEIINWMPGDIFNVIHPEDRPFVLKQAKIKQQGQSNPVNHYKFRMVRKDKKVKWLEIFSKTIIIGGRYADLIMIIDITEKLEAEKKKEESDLKYQSILENIKEGYYEIDLKGNFTFINDAFYEKVGYTREEVFKSNFSKFMDKKNIKKAFDFYNNIYNTGIGQTGLQFEVIQKNSENLFIEGSAYLKFDSNGRKVGFYGIVRDITEKIKREKLQKEFNEKLEKEVQIRTKELNEVLGKQKLFLDHINKASTFKTEFLASMSHELRTPLNAIIGFTDLLLEGGYGKLSEEQLDFLEDIEGSSKHLLDMITRILDISKIESGKVDIKIENIQLKILVDQILSTLKPLIKGKDIRIECNGISKNQIIYADRIKLKQIIYNLLSNAIKFTIEGKISLEFGDKKDFWEFSVEDTGIGIAEEDFSLIFKDFKRIKSPYVEKIPGSGLGLALTKRLVNLHGGNIHFSSELGKGTTFIFTIPKRYRKMERCTSVESFLELI